MTDVIDHIAGQREKLLTQYKGKPHIAAIQEALGVQLNELESVFWDLASKRPLDAAAGAQLDGWGRILDCPREGATDTDYRIRIYAALAQYFSEGGTEDMIQLFSMLARPDRIIFSEAYPASFKMLAVNPSPLGTWPEIKKALVRAKPSGVHMEVGYTVDQPSFAFSEDTDPDTLGFAGDLTDSMELRWLLNDPAKPYWDSIRETNNLAQTGLGLVPGMKYGFMCTGPFDGMHELTAQVDAANVLKGLVNWSMAFWVLFDDLSGNHFGLFQEFYTTGISMNYNGLNINNAKISGGAMNTLNNVFTRKAWAHVVITAGDDTIRVYVQGLQKAQRPLAPGGFWGSNPVLIIGEGMGYYGTNTYLRDVQFFNRELAAEEVGQLYLNGPVVPGGTFTTLF